jgi:hypothetical protein
MDVMIKDIELSTGAVASCWISDLCEIRPLENYARLRLLGYKDAASYEAGKPPMGNIQQDINLPDVANYENAWQDVAMLLLTNGEFVGGSIGNVTKYVSE